MKVSQVVLPAAFWAAIAAASVALWASPVHSMDGCYTIDEVESPPLWTVSGMWTSSETLLFVDAQYGSLSEFSVSSDSPGVMIGSSFYKGRKISLDGRSFAFRPTLVYDRAGSDFALINQTRQADDLIWFERIGAGDPTAQYASPLASRGPNGESLLPQGTSELATSVVYDLSFIDDATVLLFADAKDKSDVDVSGFFLLDTNRGQPVPSLVQEVPVESPYRGYYTSTNRYLASLEDRSEAAAIYFTDRPASDGESQGYEKEGNISKLATEEIPQADPEILVFHRENLFGSEAAARVSLKNLFAESFASFAEPLGPIVKSSQWLATRDIGERAEIRSSLPMISGLYSDGTDLFILKKSPRAQSVTTGRAATHWRLTKIERSSLTVVSEIALPTTASDLVVVPGKDYWAFWEKKEIFDHRLHEMGAIVVVPAAWFENPEAHQRPHQSTSLCRKLRR